MRKVLVYASVLLPVSEVWIKEQIEALKDWDAVLVGRIRLADSVNIDKINTVLVDTRNDWLSSKIRFLRQLFRWPRYHDVRSLMAVKPDIIHIHFGTRAARIWPLAESLNIPILITLHGYDINTYREWWENEQTGYMNRTYPKRLLQISRKRNVHILAVSEAIKRRAIEYGIPEEKITVSYLGVNSEKFQPSGKPLKERKNILFVGRLVEKKGCEYLLEAFRKIQPLYPFLKLIVIGSGELDTNLKDFAHKHKLRAEFLGSLPHTEIKEHMAAAKIFCLPSIVATNGNAEGLPVSILEAQASGIPVITSARGGKEEGIKNGVTGFSHEEGDVSGIVDALKSLLDDESLLESMGHAARNHILNNMEIKQCAAHLEKIYESVLSKDNYA